MRVQNKIVARIEPQSQSGRLYMGGLPGFQKRKCPSGSKDSDSICSSMPGKPLPGEFSSRRADCERSTRRLRECTSRFSPGEFQSP